ncbi:MAG: threonine dehydratase [Rhodobacteraceae bacterium]|nr:threonine dehydratase [Paracoccaceae bacterium]
MKTLFSKSSLEQAAEQVYAQMQPTPQLNWPLLSARLGADVWVKHENHTPIGAFKVRGGITYVNDLAARGGCGGIITATRGNHGQSIPFAARPHGIPVTVYVPEGNSVEKNAAMRGWGADLRVHGADFEAARLEAVRVGAEQGLHAIPPFHELLVRGVGTYAYELFQAIADLDVVYAPVGMGSGICGLITVRDLLGLRTEIVGVVSERADSYALSVDAGKIVSTDSADTFADGMACRVPMQAPLDIISAGAARLVRVSDDQIAQAMRDYFTDTHNVAESAGAAPLAAAMVEKNRLVGKKVGLVLSGGNVDRAWFEQVLSGGTPQVA